MFKKENYSPLFFLAALGSGGVSITFFMYLMFMTKHSTPIPTFDSLMIIWDKGEYSYMALIIFAIFGILFFAFKHIELLIWNLREYFEFRKTDAFKKMKSTNAEVILMAVPLTLAMTVNVFFVLGAILVPGLWSVVEYLFPLAIVAFGLIGILALRTFLEYFTRIMVEKGNADFVNNNSLSQMLSVLSFSMIAVGFAASAAMSHEKVTVLIGLMGSMFFITIAIFLLVLKIILGFKAIFEHGLDKAASPSIWIMIPILTLIGITFVRQTHGLHEFGGETTKATFIILTTVIFSLQALFGYLGYKVMRKNKYFRDFIDGKEKSPGSYALICPGVALFVFSFFFLHLGLVKSGVVNQFSIVYFILFAPLAYLQYVTVRTMFKLNKKFF